MGVVEDMCRDVTNLKRGDRLVVHFTIACLQEEDLVKVRQHESECTSNRITLDEVPAMYEVSRDKRDGVTKIVIDPWPTAA
jgi:threonine dehydrogenase-like Zn-dependent dehydrogenase